MTDSTPAQGSPEAEARAKVLRWVAEDPPSAALDASHDLDAYQGAIRTPLVKRIKALTGLLACLRGRKDVAHPPWLTRMNAEIDALLAEDATPAAPRTEHPPCMVPMEDGAGFNENGRFCGKSLPCPDHPDQET